MKKYIVITPVKNSLHTTKDTIHSLREHQSDFPYFIFDDYSEEETANWLKENADKYNYRLISLKDLTDTPSPNYRTTLEEAQKMAVQENANLILVESDVLATVQTLDALNKLSEELPDAGMIGSVTVDEQGKINFPYLYVSEDSKGVFETNKSLSFCCTLLSFEFLTTYSFTELSNQKDWFDVHISKMSRKQGFKNYLTIENTVIHKPHSSRPWKMLKYKNPLLYYFKKFTQKRDRI